MKPLYVIHYSLFKGGCVRSFYKFFEDKKHLDTWLMFKPWIKDNCIIFENINKEEKDGD